jgi:hypothetical protein
VRVYVSCWKCSFDKLPRVQHVLPLQEDAIFQIECPTHGTNVVDLQNLKFELLFESGALAIADDRTREGVLDIGASLERFLEFYLDVIRCARQVPDDVFARFWKPMKNLSERQQGAFAAAYLIETGQPPAYPTRWTEFRNRVVHQGYIPSIDQAVDRGEEVRQFMYRLIDELKATHKPGIHMASSHHYFKRLPSGPPQPAGALVSALQTLTLVQVWGAVSLRKGLREYVAELRKYFNTNCSQCGRPHSPRYT